MIGDMFHLENLEQKFNFNVKDKIVLKRTVTLSGSAGTIDISSVIKPSANVGYVVCKKADLSSGVLTVGAAVAGATDTVDIYIFCDSHDLLEQ